MARRSVQVVGCIALAILLACVVGHAAPATKLPKISFMHYLSAETMEILQPLIDEFEAANNAEVDVTTVSSAEVVTKLQIMAVTGVMPDVMRLGSEFINLVPANPFADLAPFVARDRVAASDFYAPVWNSFAIGGKLIAIPTDISTFVTYYNTDRFDEAGVAHPSHDPSAQHWNWDTLMATAAKLTDSPDSTPRRFGVAGFGDMWMWPSWWGGEWLDPQARRSLAETPNTILALQKVADAYLVHNVVGGSFNGATAAMVYSGSWSTPTYARLGFDWDLAPLAMGTRRSTILYPNGLFMSQNSAHKEEAWKFIRFMTTELEAAKTWSTALGRIPGLRRLGQHFVNLQSKLRDGVDYHVFLMAMNYAEYPALRKVPEAFDLQGVLNSGWTSIRTGQVSVAAGTANLSRQINALLEAKP
jgi:multiple sugar transport system substrate-binding protein